MKLNEFFIRDYIENNKFIGADFFFSEYFVNDLDEQHKKIICDSLDAAKSNFDHSYLSYDINQIYCETNDLTMYKNKNKALSLYSNTATFGGFPMPVHSLEKIFVNKNKGYPMRFRLSYSTSELHTFNPVALDYNIGIFDRAITLQISIPGFDLA